MIDLSQFETNLRVIIFGASGGIGRALTQHLAESSQVDTIHALSRSGTAHSHDKVHPMQVDITDEASLMRAAETLKDHGPLDIIIITSGLLHGPDISPEKSLRDLSFQSLEQSFRANCFGPAMTAKIFMPMMRRDRRAVFAALSARVSSISDNRLGGWHAYRASKSALNMMLKNIAIEYARRYKHLIVLGLHPGTVDTALSKPFQRNVPDGQLFTPDYSAQKLLTVINNARVEDSGNLIAWDGQTVAF